MIRDRLVVALRDAKLSEKLQLDPHLTLETAITKARQSEVVHDQQPLLRGREGQEMEEPLVGAIRPRPKLPKDQKPVAPCPRCGKTPGHSRQQCPA